MAAQSAPFPRQLHQRTWLLSRDAHLKAWTRPGRPDPQDVLEAHGYGCHLCGLTSRRGMEIHHVNGDHSDFNRANLKTICAFCHLGFHPGYAGQAKEAVMVFADDISQADLNRLSSALYAAEYSNTVLAKPAFELLQHLRSRQKDVVEVLGSADPYVFAQGLLKRPIDQHQTLLSCLSSLRLLALPRHIRDGENRFHNLMHDYLHKSGGAFADIPPDQWLDAEVISHAA